MYSVIDIIRNTRFREQKLDRVENNGFVHPFDEASDSFEHEEAAFSKVHDELVSVLCEDAQKWRSLDEHLDNLHVTEVSDELPLNLRNQFKEMIFKPNLNVKSKECSRRVSAVKLKSKTNNIHDTKPERKLSVLFDIKRKRCSVDETVKKEIQENISKINKTPAPSGITSKCSRRNSKVGNIKGSLTASRKYSTISESSKRTKKLELSVDDFLLSSPRYNLFRSNQDRLDKNFITWSSKERARKKVTKWANEYLS